MNLVGNLSLAKQQSYLRSYPVELRMHSPVQQTGGQGASCSAYTQPLLVFWCAPGHLWQQWSCQMPNWLVSKVAQDRSYLRGTITGLQGQACAQVDNTMFAVC